MPARSRIASRRYRPVDAGRDLAEEEPDEVADVVLPFLAKRLETVRGRMAAAMS
ncbi:hypothetical protein HEP87_50655 [Streptomyces sp. S1D4-11]|nr:hypothetical protein [Streptomyces sp. S1D4-11]QIY92933.1 hypothetical protein HEP87_50655 [Streptomyces sp. S1D4-11]